MKSSNLMFRLDNKIGIARVEVEKLILSINLMSQKTGPMVSNRQKYRNYLMLIFLVKSNKLFNVVLEPL